jgi:hypothetical protein
MAVEHPARGAIDDAFGVRVGILFAVLCDSIAGNDADRRDALERFARGLETTKRARKLALTIVGDQVD